MTEATIRALSGLRDLSTLKWYVIPILAIVAYIYTKEIKDAKKSGNWNAIFSGLAVFGADFFNETWNGWILVFTGRSAVWTAPGDSAFRTTVGWNIEIMFMFSILGIIFYHMLTEDKEIKILGLPEKWFYAVLSSIICVTIECLLNKGGHLVWEYALWSRSFIGVWLVFIIGYFPFFCAAILVISLKKMKHKFIALGAIYAPSVIMNIIAFGIMGWNY